MQGAHPSSPALPASSPTSSSSMPILSSPTFLPTSTPTSSPAFSTHLIHTLTHPILAQPPSHHAHTQEHHLTHSHSSLSGPCLCPHLTCAHMHTAFPHHSCHAHTCTCSHVHLHAPTPPGMPPLPHALGHSGCHARPPALTHT